MIKFLYSICLASSARSILVVSLLLESLDLPLYRRHTWNTELAGDLRGLLFKLHVLADDFVAQCVLSDHLLAKGALLNFIR